MDEVRYQMLRPAQVVARRKECPVVYIPIGTLEWHGPQNPLGSDTLQAEFLAEMCARKGGGLVFPPLYYGENRSQALMESNPTSTKGIAEQMELPAENFTPENFIFTADEQTLNYNKLLLHILSEAETLGFKLAVIVAGHYPLIDHARAAVSLYNKRRDSEGKHRMLSWAAVDYLQVKDKYPNAGDHGGGWETSHVIAAHPETVDLSLLEKTADDFIGHSDNGVYDSNTEFGKEIFEAAADMMIKEVNHRLENTDIYQRHGMGLAERLWQK
jgi:creatinine amidohydrolase